MPALLWEGNEPGTDRRMTYKEVLDEVCRLVRILCVYAASSLQGRWSEQCQLCSGRATIVRQMMYKEVLDEVCRLVRPTLCVEPGSLPAAGVCFWPCPGVLVSWARAAR